MIAMNIITHTGTHIDAPLHFIPNGKTVDDFPVDLMVGPRGLSKSKIRNQSSSLRLSHIISRQGKGYCSRLKTLTSSIKNDDFSREYVYITIEVAHYLRE
jgi:arylformamidase